ncbi:MAG: choice-of-anchor D domain-containing protein [Acidobacteriaceae bacterium]|nr:choice-of-anchor D domain-containing protein [Acidobacteriaceae bacterium]
MKTFVWALFFSAVLGAQSVNFYIDNPTGTTPANQLISLSPAYSFSDTPVGAANGITVYMVNSGSTAAKIGAVYVGDSAGSSEAAPGFTVPGQFYNLTLAPGASQPFSVYFAPRSVGTATGYLQATINGSVVSIATLSGVGAAPQVSLSCSSTLTSQCNGSILQPSSTTPLFFGNVLTTATANIPFTLTNNSSAALNLQTLISIATTTNNPNSAFSLSTLPTTLAPNGSFSFTVTFAPGTPSTFQTNLLVGSSSYLISGNGTSSVLGDISSLVIQYTDSTGVRLTAQPLTAINFGNLIAGSSSSSGKLMFTVSNPQTTISAVNVPAITVTGAGFSLSGSPTMPASIAPGSSVGFTLLFSPSGIGTFNGTLSIGSRQFSVVAKGTSSPVPDASFTVDVQPLLSQKQAHLTINLASASPIDTIGTLTMQFTPTVNNVSDDPAIQFLASGSRQLQVNVSSGSQTGTYNGQSALTFQTGTTAGTITFTLEFPNKAPYSQSFTITPAAITITAGTAIRQAPNLVMTLTGYDNTYSVGQLGFKFYDTKGQVLTPSAIGVDATSMFHQYFFNNNQAGGAFTLQASFPVKGDITQIGSVAVTMTNSAGTVTSTGTFQ